MSTMSIKKSKKELLEFCSSSSFLKLSVVEKIFCSFDYNLGENEADRAPEYDTTEDVGDHKVEVGCLLNVLHHSLECYHLILCVHNVEGPGADVCHENAYEKGEYECEDKECVIYCGNVSSYLTGSLCFFYFLSLSHN